MHFHLHEAYRQVLESYHSCVSGRWARGKRNIMIQLVANLILMKEMDLKALMLLCLQFHFVIVNYDAVAVQLSAITQEDWKSYF